MSVSSGLWDKIEQRIETKPDKPKYWMLFFLLITAIPAVYTLMNISDKKSQNTNAAEHAFNISTTPSKPSIATTKNYTQRSITSETRNQSIGQVDASNFTSVNREIRSTNYNTTTNKIFNDAPINVRTEIVYDQPLQSVLLKFGSIDQLELISNINLDHIESNTNPVDKRPFIQRLFVPGTPCPRFKRKLRGLYAWADFNSAYADQSFSNKTSTIEFDSYSTLRATSEKSTYSFSTSIGLGYALPSGWFIESGIAYDQINTQFHLTEENVIGTEEIIINTRDSDGNITGTITETVPIIGTNEIRHNNRIKQYELPLLVGYEMPITPGLYLSVKGGPNFNLSSSGSGRVLDLEGNPISFGDDTNSQIYRQNLGVGYLIGGHISKDITDNISLNLGLTYKSYGDILNESSPLSQNITKYGLSTGIKYKFL